MSLGRLTGTPSALADLHKDEIDRRLTQLLEVLIEHHDLHVRTVKTGHPLGPLAPSGGDSDHWHFRAVDIDAVDGQLVRCRPLSGQIVALGQLLVGMPAGLRPDHVLGPAVWHAALGGGAISGFRDEPAVNARHHDHLHLGYRRQAAT